MKAIINFIKNIFSFNKKETIETEEFYKIETLEETEPISDKELNDCLYPDNTIEEPTYTIDETLLPKEEKLEKKKKKKKSPKAKKKTNRGEKPNKKENE